MKDRNEAVAEQQMRQAFEEVGGRAQAPDRLNEILRRAAADAHEPVEPASRQTGKLWVAALLLLGLTTTIAAAVLENERDAGEAVSSQAATSQSGAAILQPAVVQKAGQPEGMPPQEPVAQANVQPVVIGQDPKPVVGPKVTQDPKPKPKVKPRRKPAKNQPVDAKPGKTKTGPAKQGQGTESKPGKSKSGESKSGKNLPKGTDPADIAAMRSAKAMLEAEKKLAKLIKEGKIAGVDRVLPFHELTGWKYSSGLEGMPKKVRDLDGKKVLMLGFMLPIDEVRDIKQFLLVRSLWSCCYGQPPDINGIVRCVMPANKKMDYQFEPMKIVGTFEIEATEMDGYCVDIYQLRIDYVEVIK